MAKSSPLNPSATVEEVIVPAPVVVPSTVEDAAQKVAVGQMRRHFAGQKRVTVRLQEDTTVQVNGYGFQIKGKTRVEVPEQIAEILEESGRI